MAHRPLFRPLFSSERPPARERAVALLGAVLLCGVLAVIAALGLHHALLLPLVPYERVIYIDMDELPPTPEAAVPLPEDAPPVDSPNDPPTPTDPTGPAGPEADPAEQSPAPRGVSAAPGAARAAIARADTARAALRAPASASGSRLAGDASPAAARALRGAPLPLVVTPGGIGRRRLPVRPGALARARADSLLTAQIASIVEGGARRPGRIGLANGGVAIAIPWEGFLPADREDAEWRKQRCEGENSGGHQPGEAEARRAQCG
ncbi:MAG: hypothetical protein ABR559_06005 [Gemmatimonadota bacterium]